MKGPCSHFSVWPALVCIVLAGSSCSDPAPAGHSVSTAERGEPAGTDTRNSAATDASARSETPPGGGEIQLKADGFTIRRSGAASQEIRFGTPAASALAALMGLWGKPKSEQALEECGAGPLTMSDFGMLSLLAQEGKFAGWTLDSRGKPPPIATDKGVRIGSTRESLERSYRPQIFESSLGVEFTAGELGGLIEGSGPGAKVTHLWAGANCIMR